MAAPVLTAHAEEMLDDIQPWLHSERQIRGLFLAMSNEARRLALMQEAITNSYWPQRAGIDIEGWSEVWDIPIPEWLAIWERILHLSEAPAGLTLAQRRTRASAFIQKLGSLASGAATKEATTALLGESWTYEEHITGNAGSPPGMTIRVTIPYGSGTGSAADVEALLRVLYPAAVDIIVNYGDGFILGVSQLGQEGL